MISTKVITVLVILPIVANAYTCHEEDSSIKGTNNVCNMNTFCITVTEYDNRNNEVKKIKGCDKNGFCQTNGKLKPNRNYDGSWSQTECCKGDYCNGANASGFLALPIMFVTYFLFK
uniref:UPAR/Ly6 domain-containing protein n=1 Tax=Caenorhabditis japonica TaxID=281687 RepID=A0A8R1DEI2_CAEJA